MKGMDSKFMAKKGLGNSKPNKGKSSKPKSGAPLMDFYGNENVDPS